MGHPNDLNDLTDLQEIAHYEAELKRYFDLETDADRFTAIRLQQGVYGQRQEGVNMVRVKVPGGRLNPSQLEAVADVLEQHSEIEHAHITTRQDIQIHHIPLANTAAALYRLAESGLTTREACGNTVRNVTGFALAWACPREHTDINLHLQGAVMHFLRNPLNQQLPRKFKISFSGCEADCAQGMIHDLGVVAVREKTDTGERFGFRLVAGGGLGHKPREAITVAAFVPENELIAAMEAIISLHNRYSDRVKRAKARIKFLVERFGADGFVEKFREEFSRTRAALAGDPGPQGQWKAGQDSAKPGQGAPRKVFPQKQAGLSILPLQVPLGQLSVAQLRGLSDCLTALGLQDLRVTQDQNMMVMNVGQAQLSDLRSRLAALALTEPQAGDNVVACPGTSTCRLGITSSTILAPKLSGGRHDLRIRASGCHNGCAQPESGDIGIYGEGRRIARKLVPHYQTYFGGDGVGGGALAIKGPSVPAMRIETAVQRVEDAFDSDRGEDESFSAWTRRKQAQYFNELLADLVRVADEDVPALAHDHGTAADFKVLQLGGGECAGASQVMIGRWFFDAAHERTYRDAFVFQRKYAEAAACADAQLGLVAHGLIEFVNAKAAESLSDVAQELASRPDTSALGTRLSALVGELSQATVLAEEPTLKEIFLEIDTWITAAAEFAQGREPQLDLRSALPNPPTIGISLRSAPVGA